MKLIDVYPEIKAPANVKSFLRKLEFELKRYEVDAKPVAGGSYAKGTYLNDTDVDVFVVFDRKYVDKDISKILSKVLSTFKPVTVHGSRDYFHVSHFEIVPVLKIEKPEEAKNITDVSPLHVDWVSKHINNLHDDVRLAKLFCKSAGVYGAESHIMGFSGYIIELLVIHYDSFDKFVKSVSNWKPKVFIDPEHYYKDIGHALKKLNEAKVHSPLIVIDPVQSDRNASASVSIESFCKLVLHSKKYLAEPDKKFFRHHKTDIKDLAKLSKSRGTSLYVVEIVPLEGNDDVVGAKVLKSFEYIGNQLALNDFRIFNSGWNFDFFFFELYEDKLPEFRKHFGPLVWVEGENMKKFLDKYPVVDVEDNRLVVFVPRKFVNAKVLIEKLLRDDEVRLRLRGARCLRK
jgi:tRNA nucleotidyltransferase (CCA-adding enzyme)